MILDSTGEVSARGNFLSAGVSRISKSGVGCGMLLARDKFWPFREPNVHRIKAYEEKTTEVFMGGGGLTACAQCGLERETGVGGGAPVSAWETLGLKR